MTDPKVMAHDKSSVVRGARSLVASALLILAMGAPVSAQEAFKPPCPPNKDLCALMIRYGDEAYSRGKYLDAKKFYRMAVAADPASSKAWALYDRTFLADLAQQVETKGKYTPFVPTRDLAKMAAPPPQPAATPPAAGAAPPPPPPVTSTGEKPQEVSPPGAIIVHDEGC